MSFFDSLRRLLGIRGGQPATGRPTSEGLAELGEFMSTREGVEGFIEPPTPVYAMTLCLVAADGEYLRRPVRDERQAREVCNRHAVPLYDARIVGYPRRMREFERGVRQQQIRLEDLPPLEVIDRDDEA